MWKQREEREEEEEEEVEEMVVEVEGKGMELLGFEKELEYSVITDMPFLLCTI